MTKDQPKNSDNRSQERASQNRLVANRLVSSGFLGFALSISILAALVFSQVTLPKVLIDSSGATALTLLHRSSNATASWNRDGLLVAIEKVFSGFLTAESTISLHYILLLSIFAAGLSSLITLRHNYGLVAAAISATLCTVALHVLHGQDFVVAAVFAWVPICCLCVEYYHRQRSASSSALLLAACLANAISAQHLAIVPAALIVLYQEAFMLQTMPRNRLYSGLFAILPAILSLTFYPPSQLPDYPKMAHVVPDDGMIGIIQHLVGRDMPLQLLDRDLVRLTYFPTSALLTVVSAVFLLLALVSGDSVRKPLGDVKISRNAKLAALIALAFSAFALLDTCLREPYAQLMPLAVVSRTVPGLLYFPLVALSSAAAVLWLGAVVFSYSPSVRIIGLFSLAVSGYLLAPEAPELQGPQSPSPTELKNLIAQDSQLKKFLVSPSYFALATEGTHSLKNFDTQRARLSTLEQPSETENAEQSTNNTQSSQNARDLNKTLAKNLNCKAISSSKSQPPADANSAVDGDTETRWTSSSLGQHGAEWVELECDDERLSTGLELSPGKWSTDFPRGLRISMGPECDSIKTVYNNSTWQGALHFSKNGYPFYGSQGNVKVSFKHPQPLGCVRLEQIGRDSHYDWSIAEVSFFLDNESSMDSPSADSPSELNRLLK